MLGHVFGCCWWWVVFLSFFNGTNEWIIAKRMLSMILMLDPRNGWNESTNVCVCVCVYFVSQIWKFLVCWPWAFAYWKFKVPLVLADQMSSLTSNSMPPLVNNNFYSIQNSGFLGSFWTWTLSIRIGISSSPESGLNWEINLRLKIKVEVWTLFQKENPTPNSYLKFFIIIFSFLIIYNYLELNNGLNHKN